MEKLKSLFQKTIHSQKLLYFIGIVFIFLLILILLILRSLPVHQVPTTTVPVINNTSPIPTPIKGALIQKEPFPTPSLIINWTNQTIDVPDNLPIYLIKQPLINPQTADIFAQKLNFSSADEQQSIDKDLRVWSKGNNTLLVNFKDNLFYYNSGTTPEIYNQVNSPDIYSITAKKYFENIFGIAASQNLVLQNILYFDNNNNLVTASQAIFIRISFFQTIDSYSLSTTSETGGIVTFFLDKKLDLYSFSINNAYSEVTSLGSFKTTPLTELITRSNTLALRIDASPNEDISNETVNAKNITFNQSSVRIGYYSKDNQLIPVYLLEGTLKTKNTPNQIGLYILPIILP